jgi:hypothetical protein
VTPILPDDLISIADLAREQGKRKQTVFKIVKRLRIEPRKARSSSNGGQLIPYITREEAQRVIGQMTNGYSRGQISTSEEVQIEDQSVFYLLALGPEHDPGRFKVGFAVSLSERLRALRCAAPLLKVVKTWPCKSLWEKTAIECAAHDSQRLHTEVFRAQSIESMIEKCDRFFGLMPALGASSK